MRKLEKESHRMVNSGACYLMVGNGRQPKAGKQQKRETGGNTGSTSRKVKREDPGSGGIWGVFSSNGAHISTSALSSNRN